MHNLAHMQQWALFDRNTQRLIMRASSLDKLRAFGVILARCGVQVDYRKEAYLEQVRVA